EGCFHQREVAVPADLPCGLAHIIIRLGATTPVADNQYTDRTRFYHATATASSTVTATQYARKLCVSSRILEAVASISRIDSSSFSDWRAAEVCWESTSRINLSAICLNSSKVDEISLHWPAVSPDKTKRFSNSQRASSAVKGSTSLW